MEKKGEFSVFRDWKRQLLEKRGLKAPDNRALYQYRLGEDEFRALETLLVFWIGRLHVRFDLADMVRLSGFASLFVLYAAEWWRRRFDGSHWSWEPILRSLGAEPDEWTQAQRSEFVRTGLADWGLKPRESGGLRFLGTVALQGGLPLRLLTEARGGIGQLLGQVLRQAGNAKTGQPELLNWVRSLHRLLPNSYRQDAILVLLADMVWTVLCLRDEAELKSADGAIARLDEKVADWRDRFPLPVHDEHARRLMEQLIRDAAAARTERSRVLLPLLRRLVAAEAGHWNLVSELTLPDVLEAGQLAGLMGIGAGELPRAGELGIQAGSAASAAMIRRLAGQDRFRLERAPWGCSGGAAASEHFLHLRSPDGRSWRTSAPRGEALDDELPWVFAAGEGACRFVRQGGGALATAEALVALPDGWRIRAQSDTSQSAEAGRLLEPARRVFRIRGAVTAVRDGDLCCVLRTGQANARSDSLAWKGQRLWLDFLEPMAAFIGRPQLFELLEDGSSVRVPGSAGWTPGPEVFGPASVRYPATGDLRHRARVLVLPPEARLKLTARDANSGEVRLGGWGASTAVVKTPGLAVEAVRDNRELVLRIGLSTGTRAPEKFELEIFWPHTPNSARVMLPFPGKGGRLFDGQDREIASGSLLAVQNLIGTRMAVSGGQDNEAVVLELHARPGQTMRSHRLFRPLQSPQLEVRLQDHVDEIQQLLSTNDSPDARVRLTLRIGGGIHFELDVARYAARLHREETSIRLNEDAGGQSLTVGDEGARSVHAICLERPGDEAVHLVPLEPSSASPGRAWDVSPLLDQPGSWLIHPAIGAHTPFRPTLWVVAGESIAESCLAKAIRLAEPAEREAMLDLVIDTMASDFLNAGWAEIEQFAAQLGHLPLATLDLWRRIARSPKAMAALALRFGTLPGGFAERFANEFPFAWETVGISAWRGAIRELHRQCTTAFGDGAGEAVFRTHLKSRIDSLTSRHGALHYLLGIASADFDPAAQRELELLRFLGSTTAGRLHGDDDSLVMRLRRLHAEDEWPGGSNRVLAYARERPEIARFLCPVRFDFCDGMINLPLMLAAEAASDRTGHWFSDAAAIDVLRTHRAFDPEWFDEAYNFTISCCLACGAVSS